MTRATHRSPDGPRSLTERLAERIPASSLAAFRIAFGVLMAWHLAGFLLPGPSGPSKLQYLYLDATWNFPYVGFEWVRAWPEPFLTVHFVATGVAALLVALGVAHRLAASAFFLGYAYVTLLESARYNNHYYLICLIAFLVIFMPADARWSVAAWWRARRAGRAEPATVPFWTIFLLRFQMFVVYFFGGVAKINSDWLTGVPLLTPAGKLFGFLTAHGLAPGFLGVEHVCYFLAYGGLLFDLSIGFLLIARRTRLLGVALAGAFHGTNTFLFEIGVFPPLAFATTLVFLEPDWPERFVRWLREPRLGAMPPTAERAPGARRPWTVALVGAWVAFQLLFPLRHLAIQDDANWTEEGQRFAWRMMLRMKAPGHVLFYVDDPGAVGIGPDGLPRVAWNSLPGRPPVALHVPIELERFSWHDHPGLNAVFDVAIGVRRIHAAPPGSDAPAVARELSPLWQERLGREPRVEPTVPLPDVLAEVERAAVERGAEIWAVQALAECRTLLEEARTAESIGGADVRRLRVLDRIDHVRASAIGGLLEARLQRVHPFALQGAPAPDRPTFVVDPDGARADDLDRELERLSPGDPYLVWLDTERMRPRDWRRLPLAVVLLDADRITIAWNHFRDLNRYQTQRLAGRPHMLQQYAHRIADVWKEETGRRPAVNASTLVTLNYRPPRPLVDPRVDLARVEYRWTGHNPWILPLEGEVPEFPDEPPAVAAEGP